MTTTGIYTHVYIHTCTYVNTCTCVRACIIMCVIKMDMIATKHGRDQFPQILTWRIEKAMTLVFHISNKYTGGIEWLAKGRDIKMVSLRNGVLPGKVPIHLRHHLLPPSWPGRSRAPPRVILLVLQVLVSTQQVASLHLSAQGLE